MTGRVGPDSDLALRGTVGSLGGPLRLDMNAELRGFAVPRTNPYLVQQVAWEARGGRLTTDVRCRIDGDVLDAKTDILLSQLEVARAGGGDGAQARIGLPLGMIVALMKDRRGDIRLSLPVGGRLTDPRFDMSEALWSTVRNVAVKAITAPVSWIGRVRSGRIRGSSGWRSTPSHSRRARPRWRRGPGASGQAGGLSRAGARGAAVPHAGGVLAGPRGARGEDATTGGRPGSREEGVGQRSIEDGPRRPRGPAPRSGARRDQEAGVDSGRLKVAALSPAESAEGRVEVDLVEPEDPGPPGRPGFLRRLLGQTGSDGRPVLN